MNSNTFYSSTSLHSAVECGLVNVVKLLIDKAKEFAECETDFKVYRNEQS